MDFDLDEQQRELRDTARRFLEREAPIGYARAMMDDVRGYSDEVWKAMSEQGWLALALPEEHGGLGQGAIALTILQIEMGRVVLPGPYFSTVLAGMTIARFGTDEHRARLLPRIAAGDLIASFGHAGRVDIDGDRLKGARRFVTDGHIAETVVTPAHLPGEEAWLVLAEPSARTTVATIDATRKTAECSFDGARFERLGASTRSDVWWVLDLGGLLLAAEMLGCAERVTELSVAYAKDREQFGRPIGSFQAVKHRAADMLVDVESLRNAVSYAAWAVERAHPEATRAVAVAKAHASDAAVRVARSAIQIDRKSTRLNSSHLKLSRMPSSA